jgi:hypothetical protein
MRATDPFTRRVDQLRPDERFEELARIGHVTTARMTQIMNLLHLAPDIQEALLFLPLANGGRGPIREHMVRQIAAIIDWRRQRRAWEGTMSLLGSKGDAALDIPPSA